MRLDAAIHNLCRRFGHAGRQPWPRRAVVARLQAIRNRAGTAAASIVSFSNMASWLAA